MRFFSARLSRFGVDVDKIAHRVILANMSYRGLETKFELYSHYECIADNYFASRSGIHDGIEVYFNICGPLGLSAQNRAISHGLNQALIINAAQLHSEIFVRGAVSYNVILFRKEIIQSLAAELDLPIEHIFLRDHRVDLSPNEFRNLALLGYLTSGHETVDLAEEVLSAILMKVGSDLHPEIERKLISEPRGLVGRAKNILCREVLNPHLSLEDVARKVGVSRFHLARQFRKQTGNSPMAYRNRLRLDVARAELRRKPNVSIDRLSEVVGFETASSFIKSFRNKFGVSPGRWKPERHDEINHFGTGFGPLQNQNGFVIENVPSIPA